MWTQLSWQAYLSLCLTLDLEQWAGAQNAAGEVASLIGFFPAILGFWIISLAWTLSNLCLCLAPGPEQVPWLAYRHELWLRTELAPRMQMLTSSLMAGVGAALSPAPDSLSGLLYCCSGLKPSHLCAQWNISLVEVSSLRCPHKEILIPDNPRLGSAPPECILASETASILPPGPAAWLSHPSPGPLWREWTLHLGCSWRNSVSPPRQKSSPLCILLVNETHSKVMVFFGKTKERGLGLYCPSDLKPSDREGTGVSTSHPQALQTIAKGPLACKTELWDRGDEQEARVQRSGERKWRWFLIPLGWFYILREAYDQQGFGWTQGGSSRDRSQAPGSLRPGIWDLSWSPTWPTLFFPAQSWELPMEYNL